MSRKTVTIEVLACDICQKQVDKFAVCHSITRGYAPCEPFGVSIIPSVYGEMREHVCQTCFNCAILDAADEIKKEVARGEA